jgi:hypothetical protein
MDTLRNSSSHGEALVTEEGVRFSNACLSIVVEIKLDKFYNHP